MYRASYVRLSVGYSIKKLSFSVLRVPPPLLLFDYLPSSVLCYLLRSLHHQEEHRVIGLWRSWSSIFPIGRITCISGTIFEMPLRICLLAG